MKKERVIIVSDEFLNFPIFKTMDSAKKFLKDNRFQGGYFYQGREWFRKEVRDNSYLSPIYRRIFNGKTRIIIVKIEIQYMIGSDWVNKYECVALC